jgi:hypothetical protein
MVWCLNPGMGKRFSFLRSMQTGSVANPVSCSMHTRVLSGGGGLITHLHLVPRLRMSGAIALLPQCAFKA